MSSHTPGPWHAEYFELLRIWDVTRGPADDARHRFSVLEELTAQDARLIAAAPNMLEALQQTVDCLGYFATPEASELWAKVAAVIRKAKGMED